MTERLHSIPPQTATSINLGLDNLHPTESVDEEPYEIKCICDYRDDDGNTILCEKCDTWQHIECYYHGNAEDASREEFDHACADCNPRPFDRALATERQRKQRQLQETPEGVDKKNKRRVEKSHKKKVRPADVQVNGWHHGDHDGASSRKNHSPQDHLPPKRAKSHHKSTNSTSSQVGKRSPSIGTYNSRNNHVHGQNPSPSRTPPDLPSTFELHSYSTEFRRLYDDDPGDKQLPANAFSSLTVTNSMSSWLHDPVKLEEDTAIKNTDGIFQKIVPAQNDRFFEKLQRENLLVKDKWDSSFDGRKLHWRFLTTAEPRQRLSILGELKGVVGFQSDYNKDPKNQYPVLAHPQPFVFFHPDLPIYIDTRNEGSKCRYIRRSCKANVTLDTYIVNQSEYHFCIVNEEPLIAGTQLTLPWDIHSQYKARWTYLLGLSDEQDAMADEPEMSDIEYQEISKWLHGLLSAYGGCACDLGNDCAFARFHRERLARVQTIQPHSNGVKKRVGRPPKPKQHVSPTTTGNATNSRAPSEGHHEQNEDNEHENRSNSGSHKSKGRSREISPHSLEDESEQFGIGEGLSMRDKRKIAQLEEYTRRQSQSAETKQPPSKKKRTSGGSSASMAGPAISKEKTKSKGPKSSASAEPLGMNGASNGGRKIHYADAGTSRPMSESPVGLSPTDAGMPLSRRASIQNSVQSRRVSMAPRASYCDNSTQTEPTGNTWYSPSPRTTKRAQIPLAKRLISYRHNARKDSASKMRMDALANDTASRNGSLSSPISLSSPEMVHAQPPTPVTDSRKQSIVPILESADASYVNDVQMMDAPPSLAHNMIKPPPPPWPINDAAATKPSDSAVKQPDLRLLLPLGPQMEPSLNQPNSNSGSMTPSSTISTALHSPFSGSHPNSGLSPLMTNSVAPSPIKKKLSLSDYSARFSKKTPSMSENADKNTKATAYNFSSATTPATVRPSESFLHAAKLPGVLENSVFVETPSAENEKLDDPMTGIVTTSESVPSSTKA